MFSLMSLELRNVFPKEFLEVSELVKFFVFFFVVLFTQTLYKEDPSKING